MITPTQPASRSAKTRANSTTSFNRPAIQKAAAVAGANLQTPPGGRGNTKPSASSLDERPGSGDSTRSAGSTRKVTTRATSAARPDLGQPRTAASGGYSERDGSRAGSVPAGRARAKAAADPRRQPGRAAAQPAEVALEPEPVLVIDRTLEETNRSHLLEGLSQVPNFDPETDDRSFNGRVFTLGSSATPTPKVAWQSDKKPRQSDKKPRQNSPDWLTATEYADTPKVLQEKIKVLAALLKASRRTMAYTGAGLSVAAGIGQAAVGSSSIGGMGVATAGEPTLSHWVMAELNRQNLLHGWVQQNHDGLPQKAGYRQEEINEIHGSWFDPSNPVVKYSGSLRGDMFEDMERQADTSDLVVVMGTSLTGLNADQCVTKTAIRSRSGQALGSVIISPQRTSQDGKAALRIFAKSDDVMRALAKELGLGPRAIGKAPGIKRSADLYPKVDRVLVPYDKDGCLSTTVKTWWDLSRGQKVRIGPNNNCEGAHQPQDKGLTTATVGTCTGRDEEKCSLCFSINGCNKRIGLWWLETAQRGGLPHLPIVNVNAKEVAA